MAKTIGQTITQIAELRGSAAIKRMLAGYLRLKYVSRDSSPALAQVRAEDGSPVSEAVVQLEVQQLEDEAKAIERTVRAAQNAQVSDE